MLLRVNFDTKKQNIYITKDFKQDLKWFNTFLSVYNGVSFFHHIPSKIVHLDACPYGLGAIFLFTSVCFAAPTTVSPC